MNNIVSDLPIFAVALESDFLPGPRLTLRRCWCAFVRSALGGSVLSVILLTGGIAGAQQNSQTLKGDAGTEGTSSAEVTADADRDEPSKGLESKESMESNPKKAARLELTEDERNAALKFAAENHPELARLLEQLKKSRPNEFARAMRELQLQMQVLNRVREKNPVRYQSQLETWKLDSQIRVLIARWSRNQDPELETQIRTLLGQRREIRTGQLKADRERLVEQQKKLDEQISALSEPGDAQVEKEWEQLSKRVSQRKAVVRRKAAEASNVEEKVASENQTKPDATDAESPDTKN